MLLDVEAEHQVVYMAVFYVLLILALTLFSMHLVPEVLTHLLA